LLHLLIASAPDAGAAFIGGMTGGMLGGAFRR